MKTFLDILSFLALVAVWALWAWWRSTRRPQYKTVKITGPTRAIRARRMDRAIAEEAARGYELRSVDTTLFGAIAMVFRLRDDP